MQTKRYAPGAGMGAPARLSQQALQVIEGEAKARQYIERLQAQQVNPDELPVIVSMLYGATLRGFCRVIARAVGGTA